MRGAALVAAICAVAMAPVSAEVPGSCRQLIVAIAENWDSPRGTLQTFDRDGRNWQAASAPVRVLFGRNGLAWGIGVAGQTEAGLKKREGDGRAPAGLFSLGKVYTYDAALPGNSTYPFHQVTNADAWIENPDHPDYNRHVRVDPTNPPAWFKNEQMRQDDPAHHWKIEIRHNSDPPIAGAGSAIFFHIQRPSGRSSSGCTTMPHTTLLSLISWLDPKADPHYILLTRSDYERLWKSWNLPDPDLLAQSIENPI